MAQKTGVKSLVNSFIDNTFGRGVYWVVLIKKRKWIRNLFILSILGLVAITGSGYYYMYNHIGGPIPLIDDNGNGINYRKIDNPEYEITSYVYDRKGNVIGRFYNQIRDPIKIKEVPTVVKNAFIAAEDSRFYDHSGIDIIAIASAGVGNTFRKFNIDIWKRSGGASTITQQLVRLLYVDEVSDFKNRSRTLSRKIKEARIAIQIEKLYTKDQILEAYLNLVWLGNGANGVAEAIYRYWGKDIRKDEITLKEAAILAGLNKYPAIYDPIFWKPPKLEDSGNIDGEEYEKKLAKEIVRLSVAKERYNYVLDQMFINGMISQDDYEKNLFQKDDDPNIELARIRPLKNSTFGYSNRMVKEFLLSLGHTEREISYYGGLRVYTTIDPIIQAIASEEFEKHLDLLNQEKASQNHINGSFVIIDLKTGDVLALSGGHDFNETQYNRVMATRSPGSGFKPFTYIAAMEYGGKDLYDKVCNCPINLAGGSPGRRWRPQNFREDNPLPYGRVDLAIALIRSVNLPTLDLARTVGMDYVMQTAHSMGVWGNAGIIRDTNGNIWFRRPGYQIDSGLDPRLPTAIGASGVNMLELANAYAVVLRGGLYMPPSLIRKINDPHNNILYEKPNHIGKRVLSPNTADKMTALMRAVTKIGTSKISMKNIEQQVACKTGTSDGPKDVSIWCGTPDLVIGIRLGHDDYGKNIDFPQYMERMSGQKNMQVSGGWLVGPLARKIIDGIYPEIFPITEFPDNIEQIMNQLIDRYSN